MHFLAKSLLTGMKVVKREKEGSSMGCSEVHLQKSPFDKSQP